VYPFLKYPSTIEIIPATTKDIPVTAILLKKIYIKPTKPLHFPDTINQKGLMS
jgi:hypothetical protein